MAQDKTSIIMTLFVVSVLVLASQTQAVYVGIEDMPEEITLGETAEFDMYIDIEHGERIPIRLLKLDISDEEGNNEVCWFLPGGGRMSNCRGIKVKRTYKVRKSVGERTGYDHMNDSEQDYGFGPGFGYGYGGEDELRYEVEMDTSKGFLDEFGAGEYAFTLKALAFSRKEIHMYRSSPVNVSVISPEYTNFQVIL